MNERKTLQHLLVFIILTFSIGAFIIIIVDPFYQYHSPWLNMPITLDDAVYQTAGAARNLDYDSAIVGTSMTENFHTSWFDEEMGWHTMKLSYSGARTNDLQAVFGEINEHNSEIQNIIMDLNDYQLTSIAWTAYVERPQYLYDENPVNDYNYVFNQNVLILSIERTISALTGAQDNVDTAYTWEEEELFGRDIALKTFESLRTELMEQRETANIPYYQVDDILSDKIQEKYSICQDNLNNITPFIEEHPNTNFYIIIPPYSMLYWEQLVLSGNLEDTVAVYYYALSKLAEYDNVRIYYFQNQPDIITDLDNYRDSCHHTPEYNRYMFDCINNDQNLLTPENCEDLLTEMYYYAKEYPYETLW